MNFRLITAKIFGVRKFRNFTVYLPLKSAPICTGVGLALAEGDLTLEELLRTDDKLLRALPGCRPGVTGGRFAWKTIKQ